MIQAQHTLSNIYTLYIHTLPKHTELITYADDITITITYRQQHTSIKITIVPTNLRCIQRLGQVQQPDTQLKRLIVL